MYVSADAEKCRDYLGELLCTRDLVLCCKDFEELRRVFVEASTLRSFIEGYSSVYTIQPEAPNIQKVGERHDHACSQTFEGCPVPTTRNINAWLI